MSLWSSDKAFRDDYEKRILPSLDSRQLSRDGRMRNPDEKPLILEVVPPTMEPVTAPVKPNAKRTKDDKSTEVQTKDVKSREVQTKDVNPLPEPKTVSNSKAQTEGHDKSTEVQTKGKGDASEDAESSLPEKTQKESPAANKIDPVKLKEMKREEEMAKAKLALERKKKLAEKAAAKAAIRAQKEAERKLKVLF